MRSELEQLNEQAFTLYDKHELISLWKILGQAGEAGEKKGARKASLRLNFAPFEVLRYHAIIYSITFPHAILLADFSQNFPEIAQVSLLAG